MLAATGVGAGDLVAASVAGSRHGLAVAWAAAAGALLKAALNEALARRQLALGTTLVEGWDARCGRFVTWIFVVYLGVWSLVVGGALVSACGLAAHALLPALPVGAWGAIHALAGAAAVLAGGYGRFERAMRLLVGLMFVSLVGCAFLIAPPWRTATQLVSEAGVPGGSVPLILAMIGGVGGSVTLLSYGYWMREVGWIDRRALPAVRTDLAVAYGLTGVFVVALTVLAAAVLHGRGAAPEGSQAAATLATMLEPLLGQTGRLVFLLGFWGAVATSLLGVWQGVPYLFADVVGVLRGVPAERRAALTHTGSPVYRVGLAWLALAPLALLPFGRPVGLIVVYAALGALFMPFLAGTLLWLDARERRLTGELAGGALGRTLLVACLALFAWLAGVELLETFRGR